MYAIGGAVFLRDGPYVFISDSWFNSNAATSGGAIFDALERNGALLLSNTTFAHNSADFGVSSAASHCFVLML